MLILSLNPVIIDFEQNVDGWLIFHFHFNVHLLFETPHHEFR
jgi:hypothetical protein